MKRFKALMALLAVILIFVAVIAFFVSAVTGNEHFMGYLYIAWMIPVLLWIFARIADVLAKYGPAARDSYKVIYIEEPDFGCEGRPEGCQVLCKVKLQHRTTGAEKIIEVSEENLDGEEIIEGSIVRELKGVLLKVTDS